MRHPRKVLQSWVSRDKSFHDWDSQWEILMNWPTPYIVVPVDIHFADCEPVGKFSKPHTPFTEEDEARYAALLEQYGDWFSEYYGAIHAR